MKFSKQDLLAIVCDELEEGSPFAIIDTGEWVSDGKYDLRETIFSFDGKFYIVHRDRTGSYYTDYFYNSEHWPAEVECSEVEKYEKTVTCWRTVV